MASTWTCLYMDDFGEYCEYVNTHGEYTCKLCGNYHITQPSNQFQTQSETPPQIKTEINSPNYYNPSDSKPIKLEKTIHKLNNTNHNSNKQIKIKMEIDESCITSLNQLNQLNQNNNLCNVDNNSQHQIIKTEIRKSHRVHKYASKHKKSKRKKKQKEETFEFTFNYPNMDKQLFGNEYIPLIDETELNTEDNEEAENILTFINTKLRHKNNKNIEIISKYIDGLDVSLYSHQQFGIGWLLQMEKNKLFHGGYLCDEMGVGKTIQIIALMLLTKNNKKYTVSYDSDSDDNNNNKYEYYSDFDDNSDDDLNGFIVHDNDNNNDQDYNAETDEEYQAPSDDSDTDIQMINQNQAHHDSTEILNENNKRKRNFSDFEPNLKRRKLQLTDDRLTQIVNEHFLEKTRQLKKQRTLIVVPLCILEQWFNEIDKKAPGEFNVLKYHGNERRKLKLRDLLKYDVVITTYDIICFDYNRGNDEKYENTFFSHKMKGFFYRIVLDEAHIIKNCNSWKARACAVLGKNGCKMRWVLTGTPIQNGLCDLFSLGRFLRYPQFYHLSIFKNVFWIKGNKGQYRSRETRLKILSFLSVVMLRRLKSEVIDNIVSKTEEWIEVELDNDTRMLYDKYEDDARSDLEYHIQCGNVQQHWNTILIQLMRLRQICSNPDIAMGIQGMCKYCGDEVDKPYKIMKCGHLFCAEHLEVIEGKCPMILCKVEFDEWSDDIIDLPNRRPYFSKRWRDFMELNHGIFTMELLNKKFGNDIAFIINTYLYENNNKIKDMNAYVIRRRITKAKGEYANINMNSGEWNEIYENVEWNKEFKDDKMNGYENNYIFPAPYEYTFIPTAKTKILIKKILMIQRDKPKGKILIYSQWTTMLNLIEFVLNKYDIGYYRYDGSLSYDTRVNIIKDFKEGFSDKNVLLISLKCGAVGLNLETANHVMFVDLWWNPAIEAQAIDRVHRIGQKKHVYVTRFVIKNSVQDRMLKIQDEKKECADFALNGAKLLSSANGMNIDIVRRLFGE